MTATGRDNGTSPHGGRKESSEASTAMRLLTIGERALVFMVALILLVLAVGLLGSLVVDFARADFAFSTRLINMFDGLLLVVILLEVYTTVRVHLSGRYFQLEPFLVVGGIAIVRHILSIGAKIVASGEVLAQSHALLLDLSVSAGVLLVVVLSLVLARWSDRWSRNE